MRLSARLIFVLSTISCCFMFCSAAFILKKGQRFYEHNNALVPFTSATVDEVEVGEARRKKKDRYTFSIIVAALMVKAVLFPLAFKAMAVMSSVAVLLSTLSLIATSIVGYTKLAWSRIGAPVKLVTFDGAWAKENELKSYDEDQSGYYDTIGPVEEHIHYYQRKQST